MKNSTKHATGMKYGTKALNTSQELRFQDKGSSWIWLMALWTNSSAHKGFRLWKY